LKKKELPEIDEAMHKSLGVGQAI
jgi:magnesium-transporting ATPase (P-type)